MLHSKFKQLFKSYFFASVGLYVSSFLIGYVVFLPIVDLNLSDFQWLNTMSNPLQMAGTPDALFIMKNNLYAVLVLISGSFLLGITTFITLVFNGFSFGALTCAMIAEGTPFSTLLLLTLPHATLELPAIWLAGTAGFKIPYELMRYFTDKKDYILSKEEVIDFLMLSGIAIILIVIAAVIEANITLKIAENLAL